MFQKERKRYIQILSDSYIGIEMETADSISEYKRALYLCWTCYKSTQVAIIPANTEKNFALVTLGLALTLSRKLLWLRTTCRKMINSFFSSYYSIFFSSRVRLIKSFYFVRLARIDLPKNLRKSMGCINLAISRPTPTFAFSSRGLHEWALETREKLPDRHRDNHRMKRVWKIRVCGELRSYPFSQKDRYNAYFKILRIPPRQQFQNL